MRVEHRTLIGGEVSDFYQDCQIVLNHAVEDDLNMRVPETLLSGRPLLTPLVTTGFELQYTPDEHAVVYSEDNIEEKIDQMLANIDSLEEMALRGQKWVVENHTYDARARQMIELAQKLIIDYPNLPSKNENIKKFAQFHYHRFRYFGDSLYWLLENWTPHGAPEKGLKKVIQAYAWVLKLFFKNSDKKYFQSYSDD